MLYTIAQIVVTIIAVILIVAIVLQQSKSSGLSGALAGQSESYWAKNKSRSREGKLEKITTVAGIVFFVLAVLLNCGFLK